MILSRLRKPARTLPRQQACGIKNVNISVAKSGPEGVLKKDPAAEKAAGAVDSDKAKAMFATHAPRPYAVFWSKFTRPTGPPTAPIGAVKGALKKDIPAAESGAEASVDETGAIKNDPALKPATKVATALKPAEAGGAPLPSIKEFRKEEPAPAASACHCARRRLPTHSVTPSRVRRVGRRRLEGVSRGDGRPGGEHPPAPFSAHADIAGTRDSYMRVLCIDPVTSRLPHVTRAQGVDEWNTPFPLRKIERKGESNLVDRSKKTTKNLTPIGRVDPNGFAALLGTDVDEEDLAGIGSGNAFDDKEDLAGVGSGNAFDDKEDVAGVGSDAPPSSTTPSVRTALPVQRARRGD